MVQTGVAGVVRKFGRFPTFSGRGRIYFRGGGAVEARGGGSMVRSYDRELAKCEGLVDLPGPTWCRIPGV